MKTLYHLLQSPAVGLAYSAQQLLKTRGALAPVAPHAHGRDNTFGSCAMHKNVLVQAGYFGRRIATYKCHSDMCFPRIAFPCTHP